MSYETLPAAGGRVSRPASTGGITIVLSQAANLYMRRNMLSCHLAANFQQARQTFLDLLATWIRR